VLVVVVGERLRLEGGHVDAERAFALARLAHQAQVEDLVEAPVAQRPVRVGLGEGLHQGVGTSAGGVLLLERRHVRRTHRAGVGLAAQPDVHAAVGGAAHAADDLEVQPRAQLPGGRQRRVAEVVRHGGRVDDLPGVEPVLGIEDALDPAHRLVQVVAEDLAVELAARQPVAVLAGVDAAVLPYEVLDLLRDGAHRRDLRGVGGVDEGTDVKAADRTVAVEARVEPVAVQDLLEAACVVREMDGVDGRVLDEGQRAARALARRHQQPQ
jgi:hypothetical protein